MTSWDPSLRTGHSVFDLDHQQLAMLLDLLEDSLSMLPDSAYPATMSQRLLLEAREHFRREEAYLRHDPSPESAEHMASHDEFIVLLQSLAAAVAKGDAAAAAGRIAEARTMFVDVLLPADAAMLAVVDGAGAVR